MCNYLIKRPTEWYIHRSVSKLFHTLPFARHLSEVRYIAVSLELQVNDTTSVIRRRKMKHSHRDSYRKRKTLSRFL